MDLRNIVGGNKAQEYIWSLVVEPGWIQAGIWTIENDEARVISTSNPVAWEKDSELVTAADTALSSAIQMLPTEAKEPNKVVFGVSASWVESGQIKKEKMETFRDLCKKLTLTPAGFVTLPEAVSFYIKSKEGTPLNAVTIFPGKELLEVSVFRLGTLLGTTQIARSVSLFDDTVEALSRFNQQDALPSRFILFDGKEGELEEAKQALLAGNWNGLPKVKMMHTPKVEILSAEQKIEAVSLGGASELGAVTKVNGAGNVISKINSSHEQSRQLEEVGFVVEKDIAQIGTNEGGNVAEVGHQEVETNILAGPTLLDKFKPFIAKIQEFLGRGRKPVLVGGGSFLTVAILLFVFWWFYPKATVTIFVSPQRLDEKLDIKVLSDATSIDLENKILPGRELGKSESGEKTTSTTGTKLVGERAKGEVEVRNGTSDDIDLKEGTILIASNGLEFKIDKDATIPAQTAPGTPGAGSAEVVADDVGSEYNLSKDERFKVGTFPKAEVDAIAKSDFTGGASRQIQAVSEDDRKRLLEELTAELSEKAAQALKESVSEDEFFIDGSIKTSVSSQTYSGKAGDEAENLKLDLTVEVTGSAVASADLFEISKDTLEGKIPEGYILRESQVEYNFELKEGSENKDEELLTGDISANLLPEINTDEIVKQITGKYPPLAQEFLNKIPGFVNAQISISPRFPGRLGTLPHVARNITVEIAAER